MIEMPGVHLDHFTLEHLLRNRRIFITSPDSYCTATSLTLPYHTEVVKLCLYWYLEQICKPDHRISLRHFRFLWSRNVIETARCGQNLLGAYCCTLAQTTFYNQTFHGMQVETRHILSGKITAENQVVQCFKQILPMLILTLCFGGLNFV